MLDAIPVLESERIKAAEFMKSFYLKGNIATITETLSLKSRSSIRASSANQTGSKVLNEDIGPAESKKANHDSNFSKTLSRNNSLANIKLNKSNNLVDSMIKSSPLAEIISNNKDESPIIIKDSSSQMSSLMAAVSSLPVFSKPVRNSSLSIPIKKKVEKFENIGEKEIELLAKYSHLPHSNALRLRYTNSLFGLSIGNNGAGNVQWPNGNVAISVEKVGADYTLYTSYKKQSGLLAIHWGSKSGLINYLNGQSFLVSNNHHLNGMIYSTGGKLLMSWENRLVTLKVENAGCYYEENCCHLVELRLDNTLGIRYNITKSRLEVYFSCKNLRYRFINGFNEPIMHDESLLSDSLFEMTEEIFEKRSRANTISTTQLIDQIRQSSLILDKMKLPYSANLNSTYSSNN